MAFKREEVDMSAELEKAEAQRQNDLKKLFGVKMALAILHNEKCSHCTLPVTDAGCNSDCYWLKLALETKDVYDCTLVKEIHDMKR